MNILILIASLLLFYQDLGNIEKTVEKERGFKFKNKVTAGHYTIDQLRKFLKKEFELSTPDSLFNDMQLTLETFKILTKDQNVKKIYLDFLSNNIAGFYHPVSKELKLISRNNTNEMTMEDIMTTSHEMIHALQDQYFDIIKYQLNEYNNDDMNSAFTAVIEGDATLFGIISAQKDQYKLMCDIWEQSLEAHPALRNYPEFIVRSFFFSYTSGLNFIRYIYDSKGVAGVNKLYETPPLSTEQILHPDKYGVDFPREIKIKKDLTDTLKSHGLKRSISNMMGELGIQLLLKHRKTKSSRSISSGWDGDKYAIYVNPEGQATLIWFTLWDSEKDRKEFEEYYTKYLSENYSDNINTVVSDGDMAIVIQNLPKNLEHIANIQYLKNLITVQERKEVKLESPVLF
ncbi:MAG: hypothetical protein HY606_08900 [Planctomycetes bacterium]|nr:hypothetical protein [Planctomycetota bacterium]